MHERRFSREIERLRDPERVARLEVPRVVDLSLEGLNSPKDVLDVGTGSGLFAEEFASRGLKVTGLDINAEMLPVARQFVPTGIFQDGAAEALPFPDGAFDLVFMGLVLHETDDMAAALGEAFRVTRARLALLEWPEEAGEFGPPREHRIPPDKLFAFGRNAGFKKIETIRLKNLVLYRLGL